MLKGVDVRDETENSKQKTENTKQTENTSPAQPFTSSNAMAARAREPIPRKADGSEDYEKHLDRITKQKQSLDALLKVTQLRMEHKKASDAYDKNEADLIEWIEEQKKLEIKLRRLVGEHRKKDPTTWSADEEQSSESGSDSENSVKTEEKSESGSESEEGPRNSGGQPQTEAGNTAEAWPHKKPRPLPQPLSRQKTERSRSREQHLEDRENLRINHVVFSSGFDVSKQFGDVLRWMREEQTQLFIFQFVCSHGRHQFKTNFHSTIMQSWALNCGYVCHQEEEGDILVVCKKDVFASIKPSFEENGPDGIRCLIVECGWRSSKDSIAVAIISEPETPKEQKQVNEEEVRGSMNRIIDGICKLGANVVACWLPSATTRFHGILSKIHSEKTNHTFVSMPVLTTKNTDECNQILEHLPKAGRAAGLDKPPNAVERGLLSNISNYDLQKADLLFTFPVYTAFLRCGSFHPMPRGFRTILENEFPMKKNAIALDAIHDIIGADVTGTNPPIASLAPGVRKVYQRVPRAARALNGASQSEFFIRDIQRKRDRDRAPRDHSRRPQARPPGIFSAPNAAPAAFQPYGGYPPSTTAAAYNRYCAAAAAACVQQYAAMSGWGAYAHH